MRKIKSGSGETLVETLAAILLIAVTSAAFLQMALSSVRGSAAAKQADSLFRQSLSAAERQETGAGTGSVTVDGRTYAVDYYSAGGAGGSGGRLVSYAAEGGGG